MDTNTSCIYNNKKTYINVFDDRIVLGKKTIKYTDIYALHQENLTKYITIFSKNLFVFLFLLSNGLIFLITHNVNIVVFLLNVTVISTICYWFNTYYLVRLFSDDPFVLYDIVYETHHDTLLVSYKDNVILNKKNVKKLNNKQSKYLHRYLQRISRGRKYLFTQIETSLSNGNELYEKYETVAQIRYKDKQIFSPEVVSILESAFNKNFANFKKYTLYMFRFNIIGVIILICLLISNWEMNFILF